MQTVYLALILDSDDENISEVMGTWLTVLPKEEQAKLPLVEALITNQLITEADVVELYSTALSNAISDQIAAAEGA